ncbi:hypothetical protein Ndes2526B_g04796 [Nannochloris sp. 'desiccata']|nr:hypothetical protein KSW81_000500 [Chlorella desiccata (nom. nud.)]KAH7620862.1 hypothetical protein NADE_003471 [Chlorella desiccata (nom. nud.)]
MDSWQTELPSLLHAATTPSKNIDASRARLQTLCADVMSRFGGEHLAQVLQSATGGGPLSPEATLVLLDALGGTSTRSEFLGKCIYSLLKNLNIDWKLFEGQDFGELFSTLLMSTKSPASHSQAALSPEEAGILLKGIFTAHNYRIRPEDLAIAIQIMWDEGFSWGPTVGKFLSCLLSQDWAVSHAAELLCCLVQGFIDSDELDLVDYEAVDKTELDGHNPAIKLGCLLDSLVPREQQTVMLAAEIIQALHLEFGVSSSREGEDAGGGNTSEEGPWQRAALFGGRVLQQLKGRQRGSGGGGCSGLVSNDWNVADAISLACLLCAGPNVGDADWRVGRSVHAYFVGDVLKQLIKIWKPEYVSALMMSLQKHENFPAGSAAAPRRIISEVMEGLGVDYSVVIGRSNDQGSTKRPSTPSPPPQPECDDESRI